MKTFGICLVMMLVTAAAVSAQNSAIDKLFEKYSGQEGFTVVHFSKNLFNLAANLEMEDKEAQAALTKLEKIRILAVDKCNKPENLNFYDEVMKILPVNEYEELMTVKEKDQDVKFLMKQRGGIITELLLVVGGEDNALVSIVGEIDIKQIHKLSRSIHIDHMDHLKKLEDKKL